MASINRGAMALGAGKSPPMAIDWNQYVVYMLGSICRVGMRSATCGAFAQRSGLDGARKARC